MKLFINLTSLTPPLTGIGTYTQHLVRELLQNPAVEEILGAAEIHRLDRRQIEQLVQPQQESAQPQPPIPTPPQRSAWTTALRNVAKQVPYARSLYERVRRTRMEWIGRDSHNAIYWEPNYIPVPFRGPVVPTIHDLSHLRYPQYHPSGRVRFLTQQLPQTIERAARLVTVSEFTRNELCTLFDLSPQQIDIAPPAVSSAFQPLTVEQTAPYLSHYGLQHGHYLLSVGTLEPRKNIVGLCRAYQRLPATLRQHFPLVLVGTRGWHTEESEQVIEPLERTGQILRLGHLPTAHLPSLYAGARLMAYPSFYEGFGIPIVEALASGTAVLTSNCASMPEVAGGMAQLVDPADLESITVGLQQLLENPADERVKTHRATTIRQRYSWEKSAANLLETFGKV